MNRLTCVFFSVLTLGCPVDNPGDATDATIRDVNVADSSNLDRAITDIARDDHNPSDAGIYDVYYSDAGPYTGPGTLDGVLAFVVQSSVASNSGYGVLIDTVQVLLVDAAGITCSSFSEDAGQFTYGKAINISVGIGEGTLLVPGQYTVGGSPMSPQGGTQVVYIENNEDGGMRFFGSISGSVTFTYISPDRAIGSFSVQMGPSYDGGSQSALSGTFDAPGCHN